VGRSNQTVARILNWSQSGIAAPLVQSPMQQAIETERPHQPKQRSVVDQRIIQPPVTHARTKPSEKQQYDIIICHSATRVACHYEEERLLLCCSRTSLRMACKAALRCRSTLPSLRRKNGSPCLECFSYVCPEPVLVKCSFLYINGSKRPFLLTTTLHRRYVGDGG
jgi:hypothetical protein